MRSITAHVETKLGLTQSCRDSRVGFVRGEKKSSILHKALSTQFQTLVELWKRKKPAGLTEDRTTLKS